MRKGGGRRERRDWGWRDHMKSYTGEKGSHDKLYRGEGIIWKALQGRRDHIQSYTGEKGGGGSKWNEPNHVERYACSLFSFNIDRILWIQGDHRSCDFTQIVEDKKKKYQWTVILRRYSSYVRGRGYGDLETGVRFLGNLLEPGCSWILPHVRQSQKELPKQCQLLKHFIQGGNLLQPLLTNPLYWGPYSREGV